MHVLWASAFVSFTRAPASGHASSSFLTTPSTWPAWTLSRGATSPASWGFSPITGYAPTCATAAARTSRPPAASSRGRLDRLQELHGAQHPVDAHGVAIHLLLGPARLDHEEAL